MSLLDRTRNLATLPKAEGRDWRQLAIAAGYGVVGAICLWLVLLVPVLVAWVADPRTSTSWTDTLSFSGDAWALAHRGHVGVTSAGAHSVVFAPLLLTVLAVLLARYAATAMLAYLPDRRGGWWEGPASYVVGYLFGGVVISLLADFGPATPSVLSVVPGAVIVALVGVCWAMWRSEQPIAETAKDFAEQRISLTTRRAVRPALEGVLGFLALGLVVVVALLAVHFGDVRDLNGQLRPGMAGGVVLWIGQFSALPNVVLWAGSWLSGASVDLGVVSVGTSHVHGGVLPMVPMLGAVPGAGNLPVWTAIVPILPVALGAVIGWRSLAQLTTLASLKTKATTAMTAAGLAAVLVLVLTWLSTAGVSGGSLSYVGPSLMVVPLLVVELLLGAVLAAVVLHWRRTR